MFSFAYFSKYTSTDDASMPSFVGSLQELQRDHVLEVIRWASLKMAETQSTVQRLTDFLGEVQNRWKVSEESHSELGRRLGELANGVIGVQSATRMSVEDGKQHQRAVNRSLENIQWQLAGQGKAQNQWLKDVAISSAKMLQGIEQHLNKNHKISESTAETLENIEGHLSAVSENIKKLVDLQSQSRSAESKASAVLPKVPPPPSSMTPSLPTPPGGRGTPLTRCNQS